MLPAWLEAHNLPAMTMEEAAKDSRVRELVSRAVAAANCARVARRVDPRVPHRASSFSEAREEMTASLKVRRDNVLAHYADVVDEIYADAKPA